MARPKIKKRAAKSVKRKKKFLFFIPYPLIVFLLLCVGVYLVAWTFNAHADDIIVKAIIHGQPVTDKAVINSPAEGTHFKAVPITVSGTCPTNAAYVEIFRNGVMGGSALCDLSGNFQLQSDLYDGANKLEAHVFNITDDEGPVSDPVNVVYDAPPPPPALNTGQTTAPKPKTSPLLLKTAFVYKGYYIGEQVSWPVEISGGAAPYALNVDWGDGQNSIISRSAAGQFYINHVYQSTGPDKGSFTIKVQASDTAQNYTYMQFFVIVNQKTTQNLTAGGANIYSKGPPTLGGLHDWVWAAWPVYGAVSLMVLSFWLGEREEYLILFRKRRQHRHP